MVPPARSRRGGPMTTPERGSISRLLTPLQAVLTVLLFAEVIVLCGIALAPGIALVGWAAARLPPDGVVRTLGLGLAAAAAYFAFGLSLLVVLPIYHRLMGARIGRRVQINTAVVADQNLIEIGDDTVIGGDVTLVCHSAERGHLLTAPVRIGRGVTVGLMAVVFPGCTIGDGAVISAGSVLSKGSRVGPGEIWAGVPARRVGRRRPRAAAAPEG